MHVATANRVLQVLLNDYDLHGVAERKQSTAS